MKRNAQIARTTALLLLLPIAAAAQTLSRTGAALPIAAAPATTAATASTRSESVTGADLYRIGPGDVLDIRVFNRPQLSRDSVRVDRRGMIRMPLLTDEIPAACLTEEELALTVAQRYLRYQTRPSVDVFIKEFNSQPTAVIGAVTKPGQFQLQRRVRLLELLSLAGGMTDKAGERILIAHSGQAATCEVGNEEEILPGVVSLNLNATVRGVEGANPYVLAGDIVTVQEAAQIFVVGSVYRPVNIPLKEEVTVSQAIAMAGGISNDAKPDKIRIVRQQTGSSARTEIIVDLDAINKHRSPDIKLEANDIVDVPTSTGKKVLHSLLNAIAPAATQFPLRIIP